MKLNTRGLTYHLYLFGRSIVISTILEIQVRRLRTFVGIEDNTGRLENTLVDRPEIHIIAIMSTYLADMFHTARPTGGI